VGLQRAGLSALGSGYNCLLTDSPITFPGARRPDRTRTVESFGVRLNVVEWGAETAPPLLLAHGGFDFAGTFDVFAPLLAAGGWRAVAWDQRGHGDSQHVELYTWSADVRDAVAVLDSIGRDAMPFVGHSKGGGITLQLAEMFPHRVSHLVSIDGLPSPRPRPDVPNHERTRLLDSELADWLGHRRRSAAGAQRKPGTIEDLAKRRGRMNPRLSFDWLCYLVTRGAAESDDGWRWKIDPVMRFGGFGPHRPQWVLERLPGLSPPMLGFLGMQPEPMGWGTRPEELEPFLPAGAVMEVYDDTGHFVHIEQPERTAARVLEFLS
jgi:pimeloyl-ACP methyl ester carboxylesterase